MCTPCVHMCSYCCTMCTPCVHMVHMCTHGTHMCTHVYTCVHHVYTCAHHVYTFVYHVYTCVWHVLTWCTHGTAVQTHVGLKKQVSSLLRSGVTPWKAPPPPQTVDDDFRHLNDVGVLLLHVGWVRLYLSYPDQKNRSLACLEMELLHEELHHLLRPSMMILDTLTMWAYCCSMWAEFVYT